MTAVDVSGTIALGAVELLTANLLLGLLLSVGYNPTRQWPRQRVTPSPLPQPSSGVSSTGGRSGEHQSMSNDKCIISSRA